MNGSGWLWGFEQRSTNIEAVREASLNSKLKCFPKYRKYDFPIIACTGRAGEWARNWGGDDNINNHFSEGGD